MALLAAFGSNPAIAQEASPAATQAAKVVLPEGTEVVIRFNDRLSSGTSKVGDQFVISLEEDIRLANGTMLRSGYRGRGEVTAAERRGMMGQGGQLNVRLNYIRIGDERVRLRAQRGQEGADSIGATVALSILFGPLGLLKKGKDIEIAPGQTITAYVDDDVELPLPLPAPPRDD